MLQFPSMTEQQDTKLGINEVPCVNIVEETCGILQGNTA